MKDPLEGLRVLIVELGLNATADDILDQMRIMKARREDNFYQHIVCCFRGFDRDSRELYEIREVRSFCHRLVCQGFISYLDYSTTFPHDRSRGLDLSGWGAFEVWSCSQNRLRKEVVMYREEALAVLERFNGVLQKSNAVADSLLGPLLESPF